MSTNKKTQKTNKLVFKVVEPKDVQRGDTIYIEKKEDATPYLVIDIGSPFILIENLHTHWAGLYHFTTLYKSN